MNTIKGSLNFDGIGAYETLSLPVEAGENLAENWVVAINEIAANYEDYIYEKPDGDDGSTGLHVGKCLQKCYNMQVHCKKSFTA